jgi:hypothetical protein
MSKIPCSCIRSTFSLFVSSPSKGVVLIHDLSDWVVEEGFVFPNIYNLETLFPDGRVELVEVSPKNGYTLSVDTPVDGIYEFTLNNCGVIYTQKELILSGVRCSLDIAITKAVKKSDFDSIRDIEDDIFVAKSAATLGNYQSAKKILQTINLKLNNLSCDCKCK